MSKYKIETYKKEVEKQANYYGLKLIENADRIANDLRGIKIEVFTNVKPFTGDKANKVFFTYSDHYHANSGVWMQVSNLHHPNINGDDRGYIKGCWTDLDGYMVLRMAKHINHNLNIINKPNFRKSPNQTKYIEDCEYVMNTAVKALDKEVAFIISNLNELLKERTNMSLLFYVRNI